MESKRRTAIVGWASAAWLLLAASAAHALLPQDGERHLELFAGYYGVDAGALQYGNPLSFGARGGYRWIHHGFEATLSRFQSGFTVGRTQGDQRTLSLDLSLCFFLNPRSLYEWSVFFGPGWTSVDTTNRFAGLSVRHRGDSLSGHAGVAVRIQLGEKLYLRPDLRLRIYDVGNPAHDTEGSLAVGYSFF